MNEPLAESTVSRMLALSCCVFAYRYVFPYQKQINNVLERLEGDDLGAMQGSAQSRRIRKSTFNEL